MAGQVGRNTAERFEAEGLGAAYREIMGESYPAGAVVPVKGLIEDGASLEIETAAVAPK